MIIKNQLKFALLASVAGWSGAAMAQGEGADANEAAQASNSAFDDSGIIVTARKQNETVLETPASITVLTADNFDSKNITRANELSGVVPGLVQTNGNGSLPATTFRGLGTNSSVPSAEASVAYFVDGVYFSHLRDYTSPVYDLDHIEFIKGTQSTLLGKNTSVGAVSVVTKRPTDELEAQLQYTHSFEIQGNRVEGVVNLPVSERLQVRASFLTSEDHGMVYNTYADRKEPYVRDLSGRLAVAWQPTDTIDIVLRYQHDDRKQVGFQWEILKDPLGIVSGWAAQFGQVLNVTPDRINNSASEGLGGTLEGPEQFENQVTNRLNLLANIELGEHTLTWQTAFHQWRAPRYTEIDQTAANLFGIIEDEHNKAFTQEVRISSPHTGRFQYLVGAYYYWNDWGNNPITGGSGSNSVGFPITGVSNTVITQKVNAYSAFASGSYELLYNLTVDAGVRYTHEEKRGTMSRVATGLLSYIFPNTPLTPYTPLDNDSVDYSIGLRYDATSDLLLYATYSKGSKSGGYQDGAALVSLASFTPETAYSTELGAKLGLGSGSYIAVALFNTKVAAFQNNYTATINNVSRSLIGNADIRSRGVESTGALRLGDNFRLTGSLVYADGKFLDDFPGDGSVALAGQPLSRNPKWSGQFTVDYDQPVSDEVDVFGSVTFDFASKALLQSLVNQPNAPFMQAHQTVNARLGMRIGDNLEIAAIGTNLTDETYVTFATGITASGGAYVGSVNRGRVIALQVTVKN